MKNITPKKWDRAKDSKIFFKIAKLNRTMSAISVENL